MSYYVRLLTLSEGILPFIEIEKQGDFVQLISGTNTSWEHIEISEPEYNAIASLERLVVSSGSRGEKELEKLKDLIQGCYPENAREWLRKYLLKIKMIYTFHLTGENITRSGWPVLGRIQNLLKDILGGIIQADEEGFYNDEGDYILWQMYEGAAGTIPAATLNENGEWVSYQLNLNSEKAVTSFKNGIVPKRSFLSRLFGG